LMLSVDSPRFIYRIEFPPRDGFSVLHWARVCTRYWYAQSKNRSDRAGTADLHTNRVPSSVKFVTRNSKTNIILSNFFRYIRNECYLRHVWLRGGVFNATVLMTGQHLDFTILVLQARIMLCLLFRSGFQVYKFGWSVLFFQSSPLKPMYRF
jgi:hypothetical protein